MAVWHHLKTVNFAKELSKFCKIQSRKISIYRYYRYFFSGIGFFQIPQQPTFDPRTLGSTLGPTLWARHSGPDTMGPTLWARHSGPDTLGPTLWARHSGPDTLGPTLWARHSGPDTLGLTLGPTLWA